MAANIPVRPCPFAQWISKRPFIGGGNARIEETSSAGGAEPASSMGWQVYRNRRRIRRGSVNSHVKSTTCVTSDGISTGRNRRETTSESFTAWAAGSRETVTCANHTALVNSKYGNRMKPASQCREPSVRLPKHRTSPERYAPETTAHDTPGQSRSTFQPPRTASQKTAAAISANAVP
jgi:hypothetical protein